MKRTCFLVLILEGLVGFHRTVLLSFFGISGWGIDWNYCDVEWLALGMSWDHSVVFEIATKVDFLVAQWLRLCVPVAHSVGSIPSLGRSHMPLWSRKGGRKNIWRRKWQPTPVFLPGESHRQRSLAGYSPRGCKESDMTKRLHFHFHFHCILDSFVDYDGYSISSKGFLPTLWWLLHFFQGILAHSSRYNDHLN